jgi:oligoribonuclease NrnB/cAMP/cGMP phosphodiesterase (DHH superfamily)
MLELEQVKKIVVHTPCMDGLASAMILLDAISDAEVVFCNYGTQQLELECEPGMLFCDFTPARERVSEYVKAGTIVLDHHVYAKDIVEAFGANGVYGNDEPGVSGAVLAYRHVWCPVFDRPWAPGHRAPNATGRFAEFVGIRDTWQKDHPRWNEARELHAVLEAFPKEHWLTEGGIRNALDALDHGVGAALLQSKQRELAQIASRSVLRRIVSVSGKQQTWGLSAVNAALVSDLAELLRTLGVDVLVNVQTEIEDGSVWFRVSLRSAVVDVGALAKRYDGGGHKAAAGFRTRQDGHVIEFFAWLATQANL